MIFSLCSCNSSYLEVMVCTYFISDRRNFFAQFLIRKVIAARWRLRRRWTVKRKPSTVRLAHRRRLSACHELCRVVYVFIVSVIRHRNRYKPSRSKRDRKYV